MRDLYDEVQNSCHCRSRYSIYFVSFPLCIDFGRMRQSYFVPGGHQKALCCDEPAFLPGLEVEICDEQTPFDGVCLPAGSPDIHPRAEKCGARCKFGVDLTDVTVLRFRSQTYPSIEKLFQPPYEQ